MAKKVFKIYEINKEEHIKAKSEDGEELIIKFHQLSWAEHASIGDHIQHCEHKFYDIIDIRKKLARISNLAENDGAI